MRFANLGAGQSNNLISVTGNLKFDVMPPDDALSLGQQLRNQLGKDRPVLLAASTRDGEEAILLAAIYAAKIPHLLTVIVPRHPQRFDDVANFLKKNGLQFVRRSTLTIASLESVSPKVNYVLGDSMGEMFSYYAACDVAFIGGSLLPLGGQNLIEASALGKPVLIGPYTFNFEQAAELAISAGAARRVQDGEDLAQALQTLFTDHALQQQMAAAALRFSEHSRGATLRTMVLIAAYIKA
jgi:3-deoxy-D-manno-octulosonic-acid transferase